MIRIAINGYGRIGRVAHRVILDAFSSEIDIVAINAGESTDIEGWKYLLKYDTSYGKLKNHRLSSIPAEGASLDFQTNAKLIGFLSLDDKKIPVFSEKKPENLPWKDLNVDVVIESTGVFRKEEDLKLHLQAGAKSVILSAPFKPARNATQDVAGGDEGAGGPTYVLGVNLLENDNQNIGNIISNASCTTNCIAPVAKIIEDGLGIEKAMMTTIHGYTSDQRLQDGGHKDYRRARAAAENIIPTSTGAAEATAKTIPSLAGIFTGLALRVPVATGSLSDFTFVVKRNTTVEEVNKVLEEASKTDRFRNILNVTREPIVSSDVIGEPYSSIVDLSLTQVVGGNLVKVIAWYDNEYGYVSRLIEESLLLGRRVQQAQ